MRKRRRWRREAAGVVPDKAPSAPPSGERLAWTLGRAGCRTRRSEDTQAAEVAVLYSAAAKVGAVLTSTFQVIIAVFPK